jgi:hypothetical protein
MCYVHRTSGGVPHFEVLPDVSRDEAIRRALDLLSQRPDGQRAELWDEDALIFTVPGGFAAAAG